LVDVPIPLPKVVALPPLDPVPMAVAAVVPSISFPVVSLSMPRDPLPAPKPPVAPVETGVTVVTKVEGAKPVELPPFLPLVLTVKAAPGTSVTTALNCTGLRPAPKVPVPEVVEVPPKLRAPTPPFVMSTFPDCEPVPPAAALPSAVPNEVLMKPDPPLLTSNSPLPVPSEAATESLASSLVSADPLPVAVPPPLADPLASPPEKPKFSSFLDPLRLVLEDA
jgi:hypothetical protein